VWGQCFSQGQEDNSSIRDQGARGAARPGRLTLRPQPLQNGPGNGAGLGQRFRTLDQAPQGFTK
jgi:hypothetical protein